MRTTLFLATAHNFPSDVYKRQAYDLPPDYSYNETCAAIGLFLLGHRMMRLDVLCTTNEY